MMTSQKIDWKSCWAPQPRRKNKSKTQRRPTFLRLYLLIAISLCSLCIPTQLVINTDPTLLNLHRYICERLTLHHILNKDKNKHNKTILNLWKLVFCHYCCVGGEGQILQCICLPINIAMSNISWLMYSYFAVSIIKAPWYTNIAIKKIIN